ncbi:hypothetical protein BGZ99_003411 [Dissophora globulifera]|uniref:Uncharacterized protein n=1 Tax=Dissophora globulifera TaxID=979702 RepID=A0A9P6RN07_9FUNG|nr:hypothetical protein BGZ99_003411 [Dissophora globulifera]
MNHTSPNSVEKLERTIAKPTSWANTPYHNHHYRHHPGHRPLSDRHPQEYPNNDHNINVVHTSFPPPDQNYNTYALWNTTQPPTPGEEPAGIVVEGPTLHPQSSTESSRERRPGVGGNKRKYAQESSYAHMDNEVESIGSVSSGGRGGKSQDRSLKSPSQSRSPSDTSPLSDVGQGRVTPESPDQQARQEAARGGASELVPKFERNADGK